MYQIIIHGNKMEIYEALWAVTTTSRGMGAGTATSGDLWADATTLEAVWEGTATSRALWEGAATNSTLNDEPFKYRARLTYPSSDSPGSQ